jgi:hypothetical protein
MPYAFWQALGNQHISVVWGPHSACLESAPQPAFLAHRFTNIAYRTSCVRPCFHSQRA